MPDLKKCDCVLPRFYQAELLDKEFLTPDTVYLNFACPELAAMALPGSFLALDASYFLRRPMGFASVAEDKRSFKVGVKILGKGTKKLAALEPGEKIKVFGVAGNNFQEFIARDLAEKKGLKDAKIQIPAFAGKKSDDPNKNYDIIILGGGTGVFPLHFASERYLIKLAIMGFHDTESAILLDSFKHNCENAIFSFDKDAERASGAYESFAGNAVEALAQVLKAEKNRYGLSKRLLIITCGPEIMMRSAAELASEIKASGRYEDIKVYASLEARMACACGFCYTCSLPVLCAEGESDLFSEKAEKPYKMARVCKEGSSFNAEDILWEEI